MKNPVCPEAAAHLNRVAAAAAAVRRSGSREAEEGFAGGVGGGGERKGTSREEEEAAAIIVAPELGFDATERAREVGFLVRRLRTSTFPEMDGGEKENATCTHAPFVRLLGVLIRPSTKLAVNWIDKIYIYFCSAQIMTFLIY